MQGGLVARKVSIRLSVCLTICLSNAWIVHKTEKKSVQIFIPYVRSFSWFLRKRMVGGGAPFYLKFWVKLTALARNRRFLVDIRS